MLVGQNSTSVGRYLQGFLVLLIEEMESYTFYL
jgi:hypothetical protein